MGAGPRWQTWISWNHLQNSVQRTQGKIVVLNVNCDGFIFFVLGIENEALIIVFLICFSMNILQDFVLSVAVSPDGKWVVSGSKDRGVQFWDPVTANVQFMLQGHK